MKAVFSSGDCLSSLAFTSPMAGKSPGPFPNCDWRFNEFPNPAAHALHVTCVELMALAVPGKDVGNALLNVVLKRCSKQAMCNHCKVYGSH